MRMLLTTDIYIGKAPMRRLRESYISTYLISSHPIIFYFIPSHLIPSYLILSHLKSISHVESPILIIVPTHISPLYYTTAYRPQGQSHPGF